MLKLPMLSLSAAVHCACVGTVALASLRPVVTWLVACCGCKRSGGRSIHRGFRGLGA
ncbi:hypothetical protein BDW60DRAFT_184981, partial [Aspergillus nidulans var. acristatus]